MSGFFRDVYFMFKLFKLFLKFPQLFHLSLTFKHYQKLRKTLPLTIKQQYWEIKCLSILRIPNLMIMNQKTHIYCYKKLVVLQLKKSEQKLV